MVECSFKIEVLVSSNPAAVTYTADITSTIDIMGARTVLPENKVNRKTTILDILFIIFFNQLYRHKQTLIKQLKFNKTTTL